jgi:hypothetical protein
MVRFTERQLRDKALRALTEVYKAAEKGAVPRSLWLRFLLAYLANGKDGQSAATNFWQAATSPVPSDSNYDATAFGRRQTLSNAHKYIYRLHGYEPPE